MKKILFVCHGNICRSPMTEFVMKDLVKKAGLASQFHIESAATSREEIGNPVYPPARRKLAEHGISCDGHTARQLTNADYEKYDFLIGMDRANLRDTDIITNYDPRKACWQLTLDSLLDGSSDTRYELMHEPTLAIKTPTKGK